MSPEIPLFDPATFLWAFTLVSLGLLALRGALALLAGAVLANLLVGLPNWLVPFLGPGAEISLLAAVLGLMTGLGVASGVVLFRHRSPAVASEADVVSRPKRAAPRPRRRVSPNTSALDGTPWRDRLEREEGASAPPTDEHPGPTWR